VRRPGRPSQPETARHGKLLDRLGGRIAELVDRQATPTPV
jgi:hypothetical protein